jgi:error-prone DNA polymerase
MGFYSSATIVEDGKRNDVSFLPVCVVRSTWDCVLEPDASGKLAVRMGFCLVKSIRQADVDRIATAAAEAPFRSIDDFVWRTGLDEKALNALAEAGAFDCFGLGRREAIWSVRGLARTHALPLGLDLEVPTPFRALSLFETINWDYERADHSTYGHPLGPMRPMLKAQGLPSAKELHDLPHGRRVRYAGLVICRQRPGTASGVVFMTMEDETGFVNTVVWSAVFENNVRLARLEAFVGVDAKIQKEQGVLHLIVERFWKPNLGASPGHLGSRDFH